MAVDSKIEWTDTTWNPTTGCSKVSPGCAHCYAETLTQRYAGRPGWPAEFKPWTPANAAENVVLHPSRLKDPFKWRTPRRVFVNSMSDIFHENIRDEFIDRVFSVMALTPQHTYQVLTKRPERMREYMTKKRTAHFYDGAPGQPRNPYHSADFVLWAGQDAGVEPLSGDTMEWPLPNVWLGVTVENQRWADARIPILLDTPAAVHFVSAEPLLGPVDLSYWTRPNGLIERPGISWLIIGGESGSRHRPFDLQWARDLIDQCSGTACRPFMKQIGGVRPGTAIEDLPEDLRVREYPA